MKKISFLFLLAVLMMTSCDTDIEFNQRDTTPESIQPQIANSHWILTEILNQNNQWLSVRLYPVLEISDLWFNSDNLFEMKISHYRGDDYLRTIDGTYSISNGNINFVDDDYIGQAITLRIMHLDAHIMEGQIILWDDMQNAKRYDVRFTRDR